MHFREVFVTFLQFRHQRQLFMPFYCIVVRILLSSILYDTKKKKKKKQQQQPSVKIR